MEAEQKVSMAQSSEVDTSWLALKLEATQTTLEILKRTYPGLEFKIRHPLGFQPEIIFRKFVKDDTQFKK